MTLRVAYLNSEYPSLSHTFIEREIAALRERGLDIDTFSVRPARGTARLGAAHAKAAGETEVLLDRRALTRDGLWGLTKPLALLRTLARGQRLSPPGLAARVRHVAYALEAVRLVRLMRRRGVAHVHVHMANNGATVALLAAIFDPRVTWSLSIHGSAEFFKLDTVRLDAKVAGAAFVRCISNFCRAQVMLASEPEHWHKLHVVHCGVDAAAFAPRPLPAIEPMRLLTVGRMHPIKGYDLLLRACATLEGRGVDWQLEMVGDGERRPALERLARGLGIADRVAFAGALPAEALPDRLAASHALVVSSFMEGVPVVLMEAMAAGRPVLATRVGGIPELVSPRPDEPVGVLVDPGSADALADGLAELYDQRERWAEFGRNGRRIVLEEFETARVAAGVHELLAGLLAPEERRQTSENPQSAPQPEPLRT